MPTIGPLEIAIVLVIALLVVGPKRLPSFGRSVGGGIRELRSSLGVGGGDADDDGAAKEKEAAV